MTAPAAMPSEEEIQFVLAQPLKHDDWVVEKARAILALFAPVLAEKERLTQRIRELALLLDKQMGTPCEQIRHRHDYAALNAIAEKRQDEADEQAARADAAEARALSAEAALSELRKQMLADEGQHRDAIAAARAEERERCALIAERYDQGPGDDSVMGPVMAGQVAVAQSIAAAIRSGEAP